MQEKDITQWADLMSELKFFGGLGKDDLEYIMKAGEIVCYQPKQYIVTEGEVDSSFFVVLKGAVQILKQSDDKQKRYLRTLGEGDCVGEMGILLLHDRSASAIADDECHIFKMDADSIENMPESTQKKLYKIFAISLAEKLRATIEHVVNPYLV